MASSPRRGTARFRSPAKLAAKCAARTGISQRIAEDQPTVPQTHAEIAFPVLIGQAHQPDFHAQHLLGTGVPGLSIVDHKVLEAPHPHPAAGVHAHVPGSVPRYPRPIDLGTQIEQLNLFPRCIVVGDGRHLGTPLSTVGEHGDPSIRQPAARIHRNNKPPPLRQLLPGSLLSPGPHGLSTQSTDFRVNPRIAVYPPFVVPPRRPDKELPLENILDISLYGAY